MNRNLLSPDQIQDLQALDEAARGLSAEVVIIGAIALACFSQLQRFTSDVDLVVALDLEDFNKLTDAMLRLGWTRDRREHRWRSARGTLVDLLPAGRKLRAEGIVRWTDGNEMRLAGFDHVFSHAVSVEFADTRLSVAPLPVIALLKIVAHWENPGRRKDLDDLKQLFRSYEAKRIFDDEVFDAQLEDVEFANAFLLGLDIGRFATREDRAIIERFIRRYFVEDLDVFDPQEDREDLRFQKQLRAFQSGLLLRIE